MKELDQTIRSLVANLVLLVDDMHVLAINELLAERDILKEALKVYKSGRYPSLGLLDKIEEILKP